MGSGVNSFPIFIHSIMKKQILFLFAFILSAQVSFAQLKIVQFGKGADLNGVTIDVNGLASDNELAFYIEAINQGSADLDLKVLRTEVDVLTGTENATCWGVCPAQQYAGVNPVLMSAYSQAIVPNDTNKTFAAHYYPHNISGCSLMKFEWVDAQNTSSVYATLYIRFIHGATVCTAGKEDMLVDFDIYPNPANNNLNIQLNESFASDLNVKIVDMLGKTVSNTKLSAGNVYASISTTNLVEGVYFVNFSSGDEVMLTKKIIVRH